MNEPAIIEIATLIGGPFMTLSSMVAYGVPNGTYSATKAFEHGEYAIAHKAAAIGHDIAGQTTEAVRIKHPRVKV